MGETRSHTNSLFEGFSLISPANSPMAGEVVFSTDLNTCGFRRQGAWSNIIGRVSVE
ncbi:MAG: hypothetical protein Q8912_00280 [Bacillota bacterium]|nr:hypothetical protein [Bacillota bacterium]MDP4158532.1 hypothetical protein [Bacillota bacterium]